VDKKEISPELLRNYFLGVCTKAENEQVMVYLSSLDDESLSRLMDEEWAHTLKEQPSRNMAREQSNFEAIHKAIRPSAISRSPTAFYRVAASLAIISMVAAAFLYRENILLLVHPIQQMQASTSPGKLQQVRLPDGSEVWLNASSRIGFPEKFGDTREVNLQGEAFFKVTKDPKKPFIIRTGNVHTTVLGTAFNVKAYKGDELIEVTVSNGKVAVSSFDTVFRQSLGKVALVRDQRVQFNTKTQQLLPISSASGQIASSWKEGRLVFRAAPFHQVVRTLERWYGVHFVVAGNSIMDRKFTAVFQPGTSLQKVLKTLTLTNKMKFERNSSGEIVVSDTI
jgi:transmembrane sensor